MTDLKVFNNAEFGSVRTAVIKGEPYFVGKDVAEILGYSNTRSALAAHVDIEDKMYGVAICDSIGREQTPVLINESGLYSLIISSKLPKAHQFKRWVTFDVLPAIRKYGVYAVDDLLNNPDFLIKMLKALKAEREQRKALECEVDRQKQLITVLEPKASYYDMVLDSPDLVSITVIAKDYGWSGVRMNEYLRSHGIQYKQGCTWMLYADYADKGYTGTKTLAFSSSDGDNRSKVHTYWTQKGRLFIYEKLKEDGILPLMEVQSIEDDMLATSPEEAAAFECE